MTMQCILLSSANREITDQMESVDVHPAAPLHVFYAPVWIRTLIHAPWYFRRVMFKEDASLVVACQWFRFFEYGPIQHRYKEFIFARGGFWGTLWKFQILCAPFFLRHRESSFAISVRQAVVIGFFDKRFACLIGPMTILKCSSSGVWRERTVFWNWVQSTFCRNESCETKCKCKWSPTECDCIDYFGIVSFLVCFGICLMV